MTPIFARIFKIDENTRTVHGRAAQEMVDRSGEIFDYKTSKPQFQKWSAEVFADSNGLSMGNVRSMHGDTAAGKLTDIQFLDEECAIDVSAKIIDDNEWEKCQEGVMTGFSIGGRYARKWADVINGQVVQRYTAVPSEISIVDRPCIPTAKFFSIHKRDGSVMKKRFKTNTRDFKSLLELRDGKVVLQKNADIDTFRKIHARGPQPFDFDFLQKFDADAAIGRNAGVREIRKAHQSPLRANISFDARELSKAFDARRLRKVNFPPQSSNAVSGGAVADTGASNRWKDQVFDKPNAARVGSQTVTDVSRSPNIKAVLDALKQDMSKPKRMAV